MAGPPKEFEQQGKAMVEFDKKKRDAILASDAPTRSAAALQLRIDGASYSDIAKVLEFKDAAEARRSIETALSVEARAVDDVDKMRWMEARRLERLLSSLMTRATNPHDRDHLAYARTALAVVDRHIKLYGLDMPAKVNVTYSPATDQLEEWVSRMTELAHGPIIEADIVDAEIDET